MNFPIIYLFSYTGDDAHSSSQRLLNSVTSAIKSGFNDIYINYFGSIPPSYEQIIALQSDFCRIQLLPNPCMKTFSRAKAINQAFKNIDSYYSYVYLADIDIIFPPYFYQSLQNIFMDYSALYSLPLRIIHENINILPSLKLFGYRSLFILRRLFPMFVRNSSILFLNTIDGFASGVPQKIDFAHGLGLIHLPSHRSIGGYDESFVGYGPEDDFFNVSISSINTVIYHKSDRSLTTLHQPHSKFNYHMHKSNMLIYKEKLSSLQLST